MNHSKMFKSSFHKPKELFHSRNKLLEKFSKPCIKLLKVDYLWPNYKTKPAKITLLNEPMDELIKAQLRAKAN